MDDGYPIPPPLPGAEGVQYENRRVLPAGTLTGRPVRNAAGEDLGALEEIMVDVSSGRIAYAVLSFGGFLGFAGKLFAVPWQALTFDQAGRRFVFNVDRRSLERAPGFDKNDWPDMADQRWGSGIFSYYGYEPYWTGGAGGRTGDAAQTERTFDRDQNRTLKSGGTGAAPK